MNRVTVRDMEFAIRESKSRLRMLALELGVWRRQYLGGHFDAATESSIRELYENWKKSVDEVGGLLDTPYHELKPLRSEEEMAEIESILEAEQE